MKKNSKYLAAAGIAAVTLGLLGATSLQTVSAKVPAGRAFIRGMHNDESPFAMRKVERTVKNIENGVEVSLTSTDAATVRKLQALSGKEPMFKNGADPKISFSQANIYNGVRMTISSTDPDTVRKIQEREQKDRLVHFKGKLGMKGFKIIEARLKVERTVKNIANGVEVALTSTDAATIKKLQALTGKELPFKGPMLKNGAETKISFNQVNIENGVRMTITSTDPDTVRKIQEHETHHGMRKFLR